MATAGKAAAVVAAPVLFRMMLTPIRTKVLVEEEDELKEEKKEEHCRLHRVPCLSSKSWNLGRKVT